MVREFESSDRNKTVVSADLDDGVLAVRVPKADPEEDGRRIRID